MLKKTALRKPSRKQAQRRQRTLLLVLIIIGLLAFINFSMQEIKNTSSLRDENLLSRTNEEQATSQNGQARQSAGAYWDAETVFAQQIERALLYGTQNNSALEGILKNTEKNLKYCRNKLALLFYIAYGYEKIGKPEEAAKYYQKIRNNFYNSRCLLYVFDIPRVAVENRVYSVSAHEEAQLREALLKKSRSLLSEILASPAKFGFYQKEAFLYADLAQSNALRLKGGEAPLSSAEQFGRLAYAQQLIRDFLEDCFQEDAKKDLSGYLEDQVKAKQELFRSLAKNKLASKDIQLEFKELWRNGYIHHYIYGTSDNSFSIETMDDGSKILITRISAL